MQSENLTVLGVNPSGNNLHCAIERGEDTIFFTIENFNLGNTSELKNIIDKYNVDLLSIVKDDRVYSKGYRKIASNANTIAALCIICKDINLDYIFYNADILLRQGGKTEEFSFLKGEPTQAITAFFAAYAYS
jgi:hypothetical protein